MRADWSRALPAAAEAELALNVGGDRFAEGDDVGGPPGRAADLVEVLLAGGLVVGGSDCRHGLALVVDDGDYEHPPIVSDTSASRGFAAPGQSHHSQSTG